MFSRLREHFGTAGLVVAIVALVAALAGGALASSGGGDGKATASAKGKQGPRGKTGKTGPAGPQGPAGPAGAAGAKGDAGAKGADGAAGSAGGAGATGATGVSGSPGATGATGATGFSGFTETLPEGKTETGAWSYGPLANETLARISLSFPIPLPTGIAMAESHAIPPDDPGTPEVNEATPPPGCTGGTVASPKADPGHICVYAKEINSSKYAFELSPFPSLIDPGTNVGGAGAAGALINVITTAGNATGFGTFAVTAPLAE